MRSGDHGNDVLDGGAERDTLKGGTSDGQLFGGTGNDYLNASAVDDTLDGGGKDRLYLGSGDDLATGGLDAGRFIFGNEDIFGSREMVADISVTESDHLDLRGLNLNASSVEMAAWFDANVTVVDGNDVHLSLGSSTILVLNDAADDISPLFTSILF